MKTSHALPALVCGFLLAHPSSTFCASSDLNTLSAPEVSDGWILLFDGKTTFGWTPRSGTRWAVRDGALCYEPGSGGGSLATTTQFSDFKLHAEFWIDDLANSGVFLRGPREGYIAATNAYEVNIFDPHDKWPTGSINEVAKTKDSQKTTGRWNTFDITAQGDHLVVNLNGRPSVDVRDKKFSRGVIALQNFKGEGVVKFRNLKLKPLGPKTGSPPAKRP